MTHLLRTSIIALGLVAAVACGSKDDPVELPLLPEQPQVLTRTAFAVFEVTLAGGTSTLHVLFENGGQQDLVFSDVAVADGQFSLAAPLSLTVKSRETLVLDLGFAPAARGIYLDTLLANSNAQNYPAIEMPIIGAASASPRPPAPDMLVYENPTPVRPVLNQAVVRLINVGRSTLSITHYEIINDGDSAFALAGGVAQPSEAQPVLLGPDGFLGISVVYTATVAGTHTADLQLVSDDPDEPTATIGLTGTTP